MPYTDPLTGNRHAVPLVSSGRRARLIEGTQAYVAALENANEKLGNIMRKGPFYFPTSEEVGRKMKTLFTDTLSLESMLMTLSDAETSKKYPFKSLETCARYLGKDLPRRIEDCRGILEALDFADLITRDSTGISHIDAIRASLISIGKALKTVQSRVGKEFPPIASR